MSINRACEGNIQDSLTYASASWLRFAERALLFPLVSLNLCMIQNPLTPPPLRFDFLRPIRSSSNGEPMVCNTRGNRRHRRFHGAQR